MSGMRPVTALPLAAAGRRSRAEAIGESLVAVELRWLGWPCLQIVMLVYDGHLAEIDHLLRAPDSIVIVETKTLSRLHGAERRQSERSLEAAIKYALHPIASADATLERQQWRSLEQPQSAPAIG
jgi:hypothetical protein